MPSKTSTLNLSLRSDESSLISKKTKKSRDSASDAVSCQWILIDTNNHNCHRPSIFENLFCFLGSFKQIFFPQIFRFEMIISLNIVDSPHGKVYLLDLHFYDVENRLHHFFNCFQSFFLCKLNNKNSRRRSIFSNHKFLFFWVGMSNLPIVISYLLYFLIPYFLYFVNNTLTIQ